MEEDIDFDEISTKFECLKLGMRHTKDGHVLSLAINPEDTPHELLKDYLGQRYMAVLVRMDDESAPVASHDKEEGIKALRLAQALCKDHEFQSWFTFIGQSNEPTEEAVTQALRNYLGIKSRSELKEPGGMQARRRLFDLRRDFADHYRGMAKMGR